MTTAAPMLPDLTLPPTSSTRPVQRVTAPAPAHDRLRLPPVQVHRTAASADGRSRPSREVVRICAAVSVRRRVRRGDVVVHAGQRFETLIWVGSGTLMSCVERRDGTLRTAGFHLPGEVVGLHGVADGVHPFEVRALEDGALRLAPFPLLEQLANAEPELLQALHRTMSNELMRAQQLAAVMAAISAEARLAAFLVDLWRRRHDGAPPAPVVLPMGRADIGSYLGLTMESISRGFAQLARRGLVEVRRRRLRIVDIGGLSALAAAHI